MKKPTIKKNWQAVNISMTFMQAITYKSFIQLEPLSYELTTKQFEPSRASTGGLTGVKFKFKFILFKLP